MHVKSHHLPMLILALVGAVGSSLTVEPPWDVTRTSQCSGRASQEFGQAQSLVVDSCEWLSVNGGRSGDRG